jgi:hypothetical protein
MIVLINHETLFAMALQIKDPLYVKRIEFDKDLGELHIFIDFRKAAYSGISGQQFRRHPDIKPETSGHLSINLILQ